MRIAHRKKPPARLSDEAQDLWRTLVTEYGIEDTGGLAILAAGLEAFDRMRQAQATVCAEGCTVRDRFNQSQVHPSIRIERDSRAAWLGALKQLNLDLEPLRDRVGRPGGV